MVLGMSMSKSYFENFQISDNELDSIYNHLLETQTPLNKKDLSSILIHKVIEEQKVALAKERLGGGKVFLPKDQDTKGQTLAFPHRNWQKGKVIEVRPGNNPDLPGLEVIMVEFSPTDSCEFGTNIPEHSLNNPVESSEDRNLNFEIVAEQFQNTISNQLEQILSQNEDLVCIAGSYFPRSLLVDVSQGHLNLCEAVLEMSEGGPLTTQELITQVELPTDVNANLTEFSLNLALQEDPRFDEVGPAGEKLWFLNRLEPEQVRTTPPTLV